MHTGYLTGLSQRCYLDGELWPRAATRLPTCSGKAETGAAHSAIMLPLESRWEERKGTKISFFHYSPCSTNSVPNPTQNTPFSFHSNTQPSWAKERGEGKEEEKKREERDQDQREGQGSLSLSVRSGGPDVNPLNEPRSTGVAGKSQFWLHVGTLSLTCFLLFSL